jgi:hypothetical protein
VETAAGIAVGIAVCLVKLEVDRALMCWIVALVEPAAELVFARLPP